MIEALQTPIVLGSIVAVYLLFRLKQLFCDFVLQTNWMVAGKGREEGWMLPLAAHAGVHAAGTLLITLVTVPALWWLAAVDLVVHFIIDRLKAMKSLGGRFSIDQSAFWIIFGCDQEAHNLTHLVFVILIVLALPSAGLWSL